MAKFRQIQSRVAPLPPAQEEQYRQLLENQGRDLIWKKRDQTPSVIHYYGAITEQRMNSGNWLFFIKIEEMTNNQVKIEEHVRTTFGLRKMGEMYVDVETLDDLLLDNYGITSKNQNELRDIPEIGEFPGNGKRFYQHERLTRQRKSNSPAQSLHLFIGDPNIPTTRFNAGKPTYSVYKKAFNLESPQVNENDFSDVQSVNISGDAAVSYETAQAIIKDLIQRAKINKGFVGEGAAGYLPEGVNGSNWDFQYNLPKEVDDIPDSSEDSDDDFGEMSKFMWDITDLSKKSQESQDFSQYYRNDVPDYLGNLVGGPNVDVSELSSLFPKMPEVISLVNEFNADLLNNISFIFNSVDSGSYGVYVPALDRAVKEKALKKMLEQRGYEVLETNGVPTAYPTDRELDQNQIKNEIESLYGQLEQQGGNIFGVNISKDIDAAKRSAENIGKPEIWDVLAVIHIAGTIVHEAVHAKGHMDEATPEQVESNFMNWAINKFQSEGIIEVDGQLAMKPANTKGWYKKAQFVGAVPHIRQPVGSDLSGRINPRNYGLSNEQGWQLWYNQQNTGPIESKLGRQYMWPLPSDLSQENDLTELQLRKITREIEEKDHKLTLEELLSESHIDDGHEYNTIERQMEDERVSPLMSPLEKNASMVKIATLFGWMNNLEISDGSTIPGLSDRVMSWDASADSFTRTEDWIRSQPRYNPTYDHRGFYYRYIEPRFAPRLFSDIQEDVVNTHPAKRFAQQKNTKKIELDEDTMFLIDVIRHVKEKIINGQISVTRFIASEDIVHVIKKLFSNTAHVETRECNDIIAVWVYTDDFDRSMIDEAEEILQTDGDPPPEILGMHNKSEVMARIFAVAKEVATQCSIKNLYVVGEYASYLKGNRTIDFVQEVNFACRNADTGLKIAHIIAEKLNVGNMQIKAETKSVAFEHDGIKVEFSGRYKPEEITALMKEEDMAVNDPIIVDLCNRGLTINMVAYNVVSEKCINLYKEKQVDTYFDPIKMLDINPLISLRAILLSIVNDIPISPRLQKAIIKKSLTIKKDQTNPVSFAFMKKRILDQGGEQLLKDCCLL